MNYSKLWLIIKREYLTRLRNKVFIISTLLGPLAIILLFSIPIAIQTFSPDRDRDIIIVDETGILAGMLTSGEDSRYTDGSHEPIAHWRSQLSDSNIDGLIILPENLLEDPSTSPSFYHDGGAGFTLIQEIRGELNNTIRDARLERVEATAEVKAILDDRRSLTTRTITEEGEEGEDTSAMFLVGIFMAFIIYGAMFAYGAVIMRGVIEEKSNRVVELIASCVKPFELLLGKVVGVGALGLTQFIIWGLMIFGFMTLAAPAAMLFMDQPDMSATAVNGMEEGEMPFNIPSISGWLIVGFITFFLLGYLIYSSVYAAIGSAIENESDSQQLQIPILVLIIIPILLVNFVADDPHSTVAVITSIIPFFAPILMPVRMAVISVPFWQIALTIVLMIATFLVMIWLSAKIYRVGILMYGKKAGFAEIYKWMKYS